eukprot:2717131-Pyramimonas_sp.AAC.2
MCERRRVLKNGAALLARLKESGGGEPGGHSRGSATRPFHKKRNPLQALQALEPGGRLVAGMGTSRVQ